MFGLADNMYRFKTALLKAVIFIGLSFTMQLILQTNAIGQNPVSTSGKGALIKFAKGSDADFFGIRKSFIKNIGQYGKEMKDYERMGVIQFGYEGLSMPVLFTPKGVIHLHRKVEKISHEEEEELEKKGIPEEQIERKKNITDRVITMEWLNANPDVKIISEEKTSVYHTYGMLRDKAYGYKKIVYKNLYPGIDVVYSFQQNNKPGFEYSLVVQPGADLAAVKIKYAGDVKNISSDNKGNLVIRSDIDGISSTIPVSYYGERLLNKSSGEIKSNYKINGNEISFSLPDGYNNTKAIVIDPFVSSTSNLTGVNAGKAIDVDYDYAGNIYVAGGGNLVATYAAGASHKHAKYNSAGVLQWTFSGILTIPAWQADFYYGGWVVDKATGNVYIGQGFAIQGFRVIRLTTSGLYDNYISTGNPAFQEAWRMYWVCNSSGPQIICAGGGTTGNTNFAYLTPPATTLSLPVNLTGSPVAGQDMTDLVIDPVTNSLYSIFASPLDPNTANKLYKHNQPYGVASTVWSTPTGYPTVITELRNRPYLNVGYNDNSSNILGQNSTYIFYWDGLNLKAFNKATGAVAGTPLLLAGNAVLMQGGVVADECNNVFIGNGNGVIKVYNFNGTTFNDAPADIPITGFAGSAVYDLAYDEGKKLVYASGNGFVASFDVSTYCPNTVYTINVVPNCITRSATATISPAPPANSTVTFNLYIGTTLVATQNSTTGITTFTGLNPNVTYTIIATINLACSGIQVTTTFMLPGPAITTTQVNTTCGASTGSITATGSGGTAPYEYNINGGTYQPSGTFNGLVADVYVVGVRDANGCTSTTNVIVTNTDGPLFTFTQTNATCGNNVGSITVNGTGGTAPYQYSITGGPPFQSGNFFTGLAAGNHTLVVRDANNCTHSAIVTILGGISPTLSAVPASATCGQNNGKITAFGNGGVAPLQYSINGNTFQASNLFTDLAPGPFTVYVRDASGCTQTVSVTVGNAAGPTVTAAPTVSTCGTINGRITATGTGGIPPYQYSINGGTTYQTSNVFTGLAPGTYTITIKDNTGCTNTVNVTVTGAGGPTATATSVPSACGGSTGSITITGNSGTGPYTYSINGATFLGTNTFNGLPPGNYVAYVRDAAGCIGTTTITVTGSAAPLITAVATASACNSSTGTITATGTGGTPPLEYSINGTNYFPTNTFSNLPPGNYTVYVRDANVCIKTTTVTVGTASGLTLSVSTINASCGSNGTITATATGGAAPLQYSIDGVTYGAGNIFAGVAPGTYTVYVRDANSCVITKQAVVGASATLTLSVNIPIQGNCASNNAVLVATGTGGTAPLTYSINGVTYQASGIFIDLAPGTYTVYVKDANGCITTQTATITNTGSGPGINTFTVRTEDAYACNTNVGKIDQFRVNGANCDLACTYSFNFGIYRTAADPFWTTIPPGTHAITARDGNGCTKTIFATIGLATLASATAVATPSSCSVNNGTITITGINGGGAMYHANIDGGLYVDFVATHTFTGLAPGPHTIIIADDEDYNDPTDPGNCLTTIMVIVPSTGGPSVTTTQVNSTCNTTTGSITATGSGGTPSYQYSINGGAYQTSGVFSNLGPGTYIIRVRDATLCVNLTSVTITGQNVPVISTVVLNAACNENNGQITITGTGGTAPLEYSINGTVFQTTNVFTGLAPGAYTAYVKGANGCYSSMPVTITTVARVLVTAYTIPASCGNNDGSIVATGTLGTPPFTYSIDGTVFQSSNTFTNLAAGFYTVTIKDNRGCLNTAGVTVSNSGAPNFITVTSTSAACGNTNGTITAIASGGTGTLEYSRDGINFQASGSFTNLALGTYIITVRDANGCINTRSILVSNVLGPQTLNATVVHASCGSTNGSITATATGGTGALQYSLDNITYQPSNIFNSRPAGNYTLYVRDANLCVKPLPVTINNLSGPVVTTTFSPSSCGLSDGTITVTVTGGTLPLTFSKDGGVTFPQSSNIFTGLAATNYSIVVRDAKGCLSTPSSITINTIGGGITPTFAPIGPLCQNAIAPALPPISTNNITGTWNPATISTATVGTTNYIFTPNAGQCATSFQLQVTVNPSPTATISYAGPFCTSNTTAQAVTQTGTTGGTYSSTPGLTINPITGAITPGTSTPGTYTVTYTIAAANGCALFSTPASVTITVAPTAAISYAGSFCTSITTAQAVTQTGTTGGTYSSTSGLTINPTTGAITPNTSTPGTYTITYTIAAGGGCPAVTTTASVTINPILSPTINCGVSTTSSVTFNWAAVTGATGYTVSYQINANPVVTIGPIGNLLTYSVTGLSGGDNVTITVTPTGGASSCFTSSTATCIATACTPPTANISYAGPFCVNITAPQAVTLTGTGTFAGGTYSAPAGLTINAATGAITPGTSTPGPYTVTYTIPAASGCPGVTATATVTINPKPVPILIYHN